MHEYGLIEVNFLSLSYTCNSLKVWKSFTQCPEHIFSNLKMRPSSLETEFFQASCKVRPQYHQLNISFNSLLALTKLQRRRVYKPEVNDAHTILAMKEKLREALIGQLSSIIVYQVSFDTKYKASPSTDSILSIYREADEVSVTKT